MQYSVKDISRLLIVLIIIGAIGCSYVIVRMYYPICPIKIGNIYTKNSSIISYSYEREQSRSVSFYNPSMPNGIAKKAFEINVNGNFKSSDLSQNSRRWVLRSNNNIFEINKKSYKLSRSQKIFGLYSEDESICIYNDDTNYLYVYNDNKKDTWKTKFLVDSIVTYKNILIIFDKNSGIYIIDPVQCILLSKYILMDKEEFKKEIYQPICIYKNYLLIKDSSDLEHYIINLDNFAISQLSSKIQSLALCNNKLWCTNIDTKLFNFNPLTGDVINSYSLMPYLVPLFNKTNWISSFGNRLLFPSIKASINPENLGTLNRYDDIHKYTSYLPYISFWYARKGSNLLLDSSHHIQDISINERPILYDDLHLLTIKDDKIIFYEVQ